MGHHRNSVGNIFWAAEHWWRVVTGGANRSVLFLLQIDLASVFIPLLVAGSSDGGGLEAGAAAGEIGWLSGQSGGEVVLAVRRATASEGARPAAVATVAAEEIGEEDAAERGAGSVCCCLGEVESQGRETEVEGAGPVLMRGRSALWVVLIDLASVFIPLLVAGSSDGGGLEAGAAAGEIGSGGEGVLAARRATASEGARPAAVATVAAEEIREEDAAERGAGSVCCCLGEVESQGRETEVEGAGEKKKISNGTGDCGYCSPTAGTRKMAQISPCPTGDEKK
nr:spidroin-1-like [Populus alba]